MSELRTESNSGVAVARDAARQLKVVTIWPNYPPHHLARIEALKDAGCDVVAFSYSAFHDDYPFFRYKPLRHELINDCPFSEVRPLKSFRRTLALLKRHQPHVVLSCGYERPESAAALAYSRSSARDGMRPVVLLMMDNKADDHPRPRWKEAIKNLYLKAFDGFVVSGAKTQEYLVELGVDMSRVRQGYACVDNTRICDLTRSIRLRGSQIAPGYDYFLCVARLVGKKNIPALVRAYASYRRSLPENQSPWKLVICGDGPVLNSVTATIAAEGLERNVIMAGQIDDIETLAHYYAFARVLVLASVTDETWGLVVNEAMAAGLPVLVSNHCGCAPDLVEDGRNGFTFHPQNEGELAGHLRWMHDHNASLEAMGQASWEIVQRFSPPSFASVVLELAKGSSHGMVSPRGSGNTARSTVRTEGKQDLTAPPRRLERRVKRALDVVLGVILLVLLSPLMAVIALVVRLDSRGPAIFIQRRVGLEGREFRIFKFRSMCDGAEKMLPSLAHLYRGGRGLIRIEDDPRVTRLGAFMRRSSLDELPQLLNVVKGDMSLVGPRPQAPHEVALYTPRERERLSVPPGITGLWQVTARRPGLEIHLDEGAHSPSFDEWMQLDLEYIQRWSLTLDLGILLRTPLVVLNSARRSGKTT